MTRNGATRRGWARAAGVAATVLLLGLTGAAGPAALGVEVPGLAPGAAAASLEQDRLVLHNAVISATWNLGGDRPGLVEVVDRISGAKLQAGGAELFVVSLGEGRTLKASEMRRVGKASLEKVAPQPGAVRRSLRHGGWRAGVQLVSGDGGVRITWQATLRDGANAVRQRIAISAPQGDVPVKEVTVLELAAPGAATAGSVDGSPVVAGNLFLACEHPMARNRVEGGRVTCRAPRYAPIARGATWAVTSAVGVAPPGQLRRAFLYYVDRERARPYRPLFYYISWFDIAYSDRKMDQGQCLEVIDTFARELTAKRGTKLDAFVFDDGWDDNRTLWRFHEGFPRGFAPLQQAAARHDAFLGVWLSPWGGYAQAKKQRLEYGRTQGFETNEHGFSLGGPKYYARFRAACAEMIEKYGVRYLKFDGVGKGSSGDGPGKEYGPDIEAMLRLILDLRRLRPDLFVNATVGTWPSPYWLWYADTIWRGGGDLGYLGPGSTRQQWITYRDSLGYKIHKTRGPLFPLDSLKFQSVMHAKLGIAKKLSSDPKDLRDDIRMAAGSGTQLQEFFVTAEMMTPELWDAVADAVQWSRANADVLVDTHWVGGDPAKGQVYGFASWSPRKGILVLRNPSERRATFDCDLKALFGVRREAPPRRYLVRNAWKESDEGGEVEAGGPDGELADRLEFELAPFEVLTLEALPADGLCTVLVDERTEEPVRAIAAEYRRRTGHRIVLRPRPAASVNDLVRKKRADADVAVCLADGGDGKTAAGELPGAKTVAWKYPGGSPVHAAALREHPDAAPFVRFLGGPTGHRLWSESKAGFTMTTGKTHAKAFEWVVEHRVGHTYPLTAMRMMRECGGIRDGVCIDIGCGTGNLDIELANRSNFKIIGLDIDPDMKPLFEKRIREAGLQKRISFVVGDAQKLPFEDDSADAIVSRGTLTFIPDIGKCLKEVDRVLKPTGVAFLGGRYIYTPQKDKITTEKLRKIVADAGIPGATVIDARGQWVKIVGPKAPKAARAHQGGPRMLAHRIIADYAITKGDCLVVCRGDGGLERGLQQGLVEMTGVKITALYPNEKVAGEAEKRIREAKLADRITCKVGTLDALPFDEASFDLVAGVGPILIWGDRERKMRELYRVLRDGGAALIGGKYLGMPDFRKVSSDTLRRSAAKTGIPGIRVVDDMGQWVEVRKGIKDRGLRD